MQKRGGRGRRETHRKRKEEKHKKKRKNKRNRKKKNPIKKEQKKKKEVSRSFMVKVVNSSDADISKGSKLVGFQT